MDRVFQREVVVVPGESSARSRQPAGQLAYLEQLSAARRTYRFSRNVLAFTMPLPIALAFHAQKDPEGSTWYSDGVFECASKPAIRSETPKGRTPLYGQNDRG